MIVRKEKEAKEHATCQGRKKNKYSKERKKERSYDVIYHVPVVCIKK